MEASGKYFLYILTHHVKARLTGFYSDSNSVHPYCGLGNHTTMQEVDVFHALHNSEYL